MSNLIITLEQAKEQITALGKAFLLGQNLDMEEVSRNLQPFANIENAIDREIRKMSKSGTIAKRSTLS